MFLLTASLTSAKQSNCLWGQKLQGQCPRATFLHAEVVIFLLCLFCESHGDRIDITHDGTVRYSIASICRSPTSLYYTNKFLNRHQLTILGRHVTCLIRAINTHYSLVAQYIKSPASATILHVALLAMPYGHVALWFQVTLL